MKKLIFSILLITAVIGQNVANTANNNRLNSFTSTSSTGSFIGFGSVTPSSAIISFDSTAPSASGAISTSSAQRTVTTSSSSGTSRISGLSDIFSSTESQQGGNGVATRTTTVTSSPGQNQFGLLSTNINLNGGSFGSTQTTGGVIGGFTGITGINQNQIRVQNGTSSSTQSSAGRSSAASTLTTSTATSSAGGLSTLANQSVDQILLQQQRQASVISGTNQITLPEIDKNSPEFSDPQFLKILNNYFGCKTWENGVCKSCSQNFYFNDKGICCQVKPQCEQFNLAVGICDRCYPGYTVVDGQCEKIDIAQNILYKGCRTFKYDNPNQANQCVQCAARHVFKNGICTQVSDTCQTWNNQGNCLTCYNGYVLSATDCVVNTRIVTVDDPLCSQVKGTACVSCAQRSYFNSQGKCQQVSPDCNTWDRLNGTCLSCYKGYALSANKQCVLLPPVGPNDIGCAEFNWDQQICLKCSERWAFDNSGKCQVLDLNCFTFNPSEVSKCLTCYKGYALNRVSGKCQIDRATEIPRDLGCSQWNWDQQVCLKCSINYRFNTRGVCQPLDPNCKTYNNTNQSNCLECYRGFIISNNICILDPLNVLPPRDQGCKNWNWNTQVCLECSQRWKFDSRGRCQPLDANCRQFTQQGACSVCYKGYRVNNSDGTCVIRQENINGPTDVGCAKWNWDLQVCEQCSIRWAFNSQGRCIIQNNDCKTFNGQNVCIECYSGFRIDNRTNTCVISDEGVVAVNLDKGCAQWDWATLTCKKCAERYIFDTSRRICTPLDNNCKSFNRSVCIECYKGFELNSRNQCQQSSFNIQGPTDKGCARWNWDTQVCQQCSPKWRFNSQGRCVQVDLNCLQFDNRTQDCISCYKGFILNTQTKICVIDPINLNPVRDLGCKDWNWDLQICLKCSQSYTFNARGLCTPIDPNCRTFSNDNTCIECFKGYRVDRNRSTCILDQAFNNVAVDVGCAQWNWDLQVCTKCSVRFMMNSRGQCVKQGDDCKVFDNNGVCIQCYKGFILNSARQCIVSNQTAAADVGCKTWDWENQICLECSNRFIFNLQGKCTKVDDSCRQFNQLGCISCYKGYTLNAGKCVLSQVQITGPTDLGCAQWNWDTQVCLKCSQRYVFDSRGLCKKVDDLCAQWSQITGACTACYQGYLLSGSTCVLKSPFCKNQNAVGNCLQCYDGFILYKGQCTPLSRIADIALYYAECCPEKLIELRQNGRLI